MGLLNYYFSEADWLTAGLAVFIPLWVIILIIAHAVLKKKNKNFGVWRVMCFVPLLLCVVHFLIRRFRGDGAIQTMAQFYGAVYIAAVITALWQFFAKRRHGHRITAVITLLSTVIALLATSIYALTVNMANYTLMNYEESFSGVIDTLKEKYVLEQWKEIDFDDLETKLMPQVKKAQEENDPVGYYAALTELQYYMSDGHVGVYSHKPEWSHEAAERLAGDDHGFSMFTLDNGDTIAVLTDKESEAYKSGIHEGTVITKWNGEDIDTAKASVKCIYPDMTFPVKENEERFKAAFLAGKGGEQVEVTFLDENGDQKTAMVKSSGSYARRLSRVGIKLSASKDYDSPEEMMNDNFTAKMISDDCGYLLINCESYDNIKDITCIFTGEYPEITELVRKKLDDMKAQGMKKLIIDIRNNAGGMDEISGAVTALFTDEKLYINGMGKVVNGEYKHIYKHYLDPDGTYKDMPVVVLTNYMCASAGDGLAYDLSRCPNVTTMGITQPCGVNQFTGGYIKTSDNEITFAYPDSLSLDEDGQIFIDTNADRISRDPVDVKIPVTADAAKIIFGDSEKDYELDYALEYLSQK
ncbi:MAG: S41 family peptidase [Oscillospiraceae bacterium]|nr:S41 family peptidase [Oscillospiraceae bacterium]